MNTRQRGRDTGRGRNRFPMGSPMWDSIPGSWNHALSHPGAPNFFSIPFCYLSIKFQPWPLVPSKTHPFFLKSFFFNTFLVIIVDLFCQFYPSFTPCLW